MALDPTTFDPNFDLHAFARDNDGLFTLEEAERAGMKHDIRRRFVKAGVIERIHYGVYRFVAAPDSWRSRALAATTAGGDVCGLSHGSAWKVHGLPRASRAIEIITPRWDRAQHGGLVVHEFSGLLASDLTVESRLPVVVCELAVLQLAGQRDVGVNVVERAIYAARRTGRATNGSLAEYLYRRARRGRPGVRKMRAALERSFAHGRPTDSETETSVLHALRSNGFPEPTLQYVLRDENGRFIARVDLAYPQWRIILEYNSRLFHIGRRDEDDRRTNWAAQYGWWAIPVVGADLNDDGAGLVRALRGALRTLGHAQPA